MTVYSSNNYRSGERGDFEKQGGQRYQSGYHGGSQSRESFGFHGEQRPSQYQHHSYGGHNQQQSFGGYNQQQSYGGSSYHRGENNPAYGNRSGFNHQTPEFSAPARGGGDFGRKMRQFTQETMKFRKTTRDTDFFWMTQSQNIEQDRQRGGIPPRKSARRLDEEEIELFREHTGVVGINFDKYDDIPVERIGEGIDDMPAIFSFQEIFTIFKMPAFVERNVSLLKYTKPTPVQKYALPIGLCGRDLMVCAQTGSGKTATFIVPIVGILNQANAVENMTTSFEGPASPKAVILAPTRELCTQITQEALKFCHRSPFKVIQIYGGVEARPQLTQLSRGCDILTATPGRLIDFIDRGVISMSKVQILVLDEADRMLDMGFEPQIRNIVEGRDMPQQRQTMLFSATFPKEIQHLAMDFLYNYVWVAVGQVGGAAESVKQVFTQATPDTKQHLLMEALSSEEVLSMQTLVFVARKRTASFLCNFLCRNKIPAAEIHGDLSQSERERALAMFRAKQIRILVATDVAARGLDIPSVGHVVNFDLPSGIDDYVHRIGRTGRIGNTGIATSFYVSDRDCGGDATASNSGLLKDLVTVLENVGTQIPQFMIDEVVMKHGRRQPVRGGRGGARFGGRDARNGNFAAPKRRD